jgi:hypothetical protein
MNFLVRVLLLVSIMGLSGMGLAFSAFAGDVKKPTLKGQENKYRKAGDPKPLVDTQEAGELEEAVEPKAPPRRGPHDDLRDRYGRQIDPSEIPEDRFGRQGGRYDGRDGRYRRPEGRYDRQDERFDRGDQQYEVQGDKREQRYGRYDKAPTPGQKIQERRLKSHFKSHYRHSRYYRQAYRSSSSGRFRHFNNSRYQSGVIPGKSQNTPGATRSRSLPYRYK